MLLLYTSPNCRYCDKVKESFKENGTTFEERNIINPEYRQELIERGGKLQMPFLYDTETATSIYESDDIIAYIRN